MSENNFGTSVLAATVKKSKASYKNVYAPDNLKQPFTDGKKFFCSAVFDGRVKNLECTQEIYETIMRKKITRKAFKHIVFLYEDAENVIHRLDVSAETSAEPVDREGEILARFDSISGFSAVLKDSYGLNRKDMIGLTNELNNAEKVSEGDSFFGLYRVLDVKQVSNSIYEVKIQRILNSGQATIKTI